MYIDIDQIVKDFELNNGSKDEIRKQLKIKLKDCHPDKNGGEFKNVDQKKQYDKLSAAIEYLDMPIEVALRKEINDLSLIIKDMAVRRNENDILAKRDESLIKKIENNVRSYVSSHLFPKITSSVITVFMSFLWIFPKTVSEHEVLSRFLDVDSPLFDIFWFFTLLCSGTLWLMLSKLERKDKELKNSLKIESNQNMLFESFVETKIKDNYKSKEVSFRKEEFIEFIRGFNFRTYSYKPAKSLFLNPLINHDSRLDMGLAQDLCEIILIRMQSKELITAKIQKTISDVYVIDLEEEMRNYYC